MSDLNLTWHEVLKKEGIDPLLAESLIGFISWNEGENYNNLGKEINDVLNGYEGKISAIDVLSSKYGDRGILFMKDEVSSNNANNIFNVIMEYEENNVYDM